MARYVATVESPHPAAEVFDYVADFTTNAGWDAGSRPHARVCERAIRPSAPPGDLSVSLRRLWEWPPEIMAARPAKLRTTLHSPNPSTVRVRERASLPRAIVIRSGPAHGRSTSLAPQPRSRLWP